MNDPLLVAAQHERDDLLLTEEIDKRLAVLLSHEDVSPRARALLRNLLKHYAKSPTPFRSCVRDNMKRFGPGRTEKICATIKDLIRGTHRWRSTERNRVTASVPPEISDEIERILLSIPDDSLDQIVMEVSRV